MPGPGSKPSLAALLGAAGLGVIVLACTSRGGGDDPEASPAGKPAATEVTLPEEDPTKPVAEVVRSGGDPYADAELEISFDPPEAVPRMAPAKPAVSPSPATGRWKARQLWDEHANVRAVDSDGKRIYFADMMGLEGRVVSKIRSMPLGGGELSIDVPDQGRVDAIVASDAALAWVAMPGEGAGPPQLWMRSLEEGAHPHLVDPRYGTANHLARLGDAYFFVLPVTQQGRLGGIARVSASTPQPTGGAKTAIGRALGPAFAPVADDERLYFMAHQMAAEDIIYSVDAGGEDLHAHVSMPRGLVALAQYGPHIYWARIGEDGRSTELGRVGKQAGSVPEALATVADRVYETIAVTDAGVWLGTSAAEPSGQVIRVPLEGGEVEEVYTVPRVWKLFTAGTRVFVHAEAPGPEGAAHRRFVELQG